MKRQVQKAKEKHEKQEKQLPNQDMLLKLMALMGNKPGAQPSMDPAKFLEQQEQKAAREGEIRKMKLQTKQVKSDNAAANEQYKVDVARVDLEDTKRKAENEQELLTIEKQIKGVQGGIRNLNMQIDQAKHEMNKNTRYGNLEAEKAKRDNLKRDLKTLKSSINYLVKDLKPDEMTVFTNTTSKIEHCINALNGLEKALTQKKDVSRKQQLVEKLADELETGLSEILDINQRLKFDIEQEEDTIKIGNDRIKRMRDMNKEKNELEHKLAITTKAAESAGYVINRDENGKPIKVYDEKLLRPLVKPEDDETVKEYKQFLKKLINYLDRRVSENGDEWHGVITSNFKGFENEFEEFDKRYSELPDKQKLNADGKLLKTFDEVVKYYQYFSDIKDKAFKAAEEKYKEDEVRNQVVMSLPKVVKTEINEDTIANLNAKVDQLKRKVEAKKRQVKYKRDLDIEVEEISNKIDRLEAELRINPEKITDEQLNALAKLKQQFKDTKRQLEVRDKETKRVESIEDEAADIRFKNAVDSKRLTDSPTSKKTRDEEQEKAINAKIEAERQRELNESMEMTHKSEREKRMLEMKENAAQSEKVKELEEKIVAERARGKVAEDEKQRLETLAEVRKNTRDKIIARDAQRKLNEHKRTQSGSAIDDATTTLLVMGNELDRQAAEDDKFKAELKPLIQRFQSHPDQFDAFNKVIRSDQFNGFDTIDALQDATTTRENLQGLKDFFTQYDRGDIVIPNDDESSDVDEFLQ